MSNFKRIVRGYFCFYRLKDLQLEAILWIVYYNNKEDSKMRITHWFGMFSHLYLLIPKYFPSCFLLQEYDQLHATFFFSFYVCSWFFSSITIPPILYFLSKKIFSLNFISSVSLISLFVAQSSFLKVLFLFLVLQATILVSPVPSFLFLCC